MEFTTKSLIAIAFLLPGVLASPTRICVPKTITVAGVTETLPPITRTISVGRTTISVPAVTTTVSVSLPGTTITEPGLTSTVSLPGTTITQAPVTVTVPRTTILSTITNTVTISIPL